MIGKWPVVFTDTHPHIVLRVGISLSSRLVLCSVIPWLFLVASAILVYIGISER